MSEIILRRTGNAPLLFDGELLAESRGENARRPHWHDIRVYRVDGASSRYAVSIAYRSTFEGVAELDEGRIVASLDAVAETLRRYYPLSAYVGREVFFASPELVRLREMRQRTNVIARYQGQVSDVLDALGCAVKV